MSEIEFKPSQNCDVVMKGGITSGVVYPLAVTKLSEKFVFKNIGGTSAGAIAAAAAAAAELTRNSGGFDRLKDLPGFLSGQAPDGSGSNLFAFFQPQPQTARLFRIGAAALGGGFAGVSRVALGMVSAYFGWFVLGLIPAILFLTMACISSTGVFLIVCVLIAIALLLGGVSLCIGVALGVDLTRSLPGNFYGLCSGMSEDFYDVGENPVPKRGKPLTYWLTEYLNGFQNRKACDTPLTFGDLWGTRDQKAARNINLEMMTTCLTHGRPYRLPFRDDDDVRENRLFYFNEDEFRALFPKSVVDWMKDHPHPPKDNDKDDAAHRALLAAKKLFPLPDPADFPIVVAVRMSLSFPVLLSAIPLYGIDRSRDPKGENPEQCWFSDGGVCSNFPIHFFDSPLPRWPTFSINLIEKPQGTKPNDLLKPEMPKSNSAGIQENWNRFAFTEELDATDGHLVVREKSGLGKLVAFAGAFITTMQNWSDNTQSRLPGFRDRIAAVGLTPEEGGLNLNMPQGRIKDLTDRGTAAGDEFIARFGEPPINAKMNWANHRWLRMRACLASLETMLSRIERACANPQTGDIDYETWIHDTPPNDGAPSYDWTGLTQQKLALKILQDLRGIVANYKEADCSVADNSPRPRPELRPRAQL